MSRTERVVHCPPEHVFAVLADGWTYATWVVGAARIRAVDDGWPAVGASIHHSVGGWPLLLSDTTQVEQVEQADTGARLQLKVRAWPTGAGRVRLTLTPIPDAGGTGGVGTRVTMEEDAVAGPARMVPRLVRDPMLHARNVEALRRLALLAEGRGGAAE
ncbi:SRPBCC family protein [Nocardioides sp.]|uniref:SRPBCC family protein n=1 Tax=Nocardioides sp. TaxID=35761 RepID=UPI003518B3C3